jgi:Protein of unknown function (DUF2877)
MSAVISASTIAITDLQRIPGFEETDYAYLYGNIVWAGDHASTQHQHPRNAFLPWQPANFAFNGNKLREGAVVCKNLFESNHPLAKSAKGLMLWLMNKDMPFPLTRSAVRFDEIKRALASNDLQAFTSAALRVLGLGNGLTPSGDDFVGGILFGLAYAPRPSWKDEMPAAIVRIHDAAQESTNVISAALLDDLMAGKSYGALHDVLSALHTNDITNIEAACTRLLNLGASSGADILAGLLLAFTTQCIESTRSVHWTTEFTLNL